MRQLRCTRLEFVQMKHDRMHRKADAQADALARRSAARPKAAEYFALVRKKPKARSVSPRGCERVPAVRALLFEVTRHRAVFAGRRP
jgi:hypothetical protein